MTGYYDIVLGLIPLAMGSVTAVLLYAGLALTTALPLASLVAMGLIGHAMFVNAPVDAPQAPDSAGRSSGQQADGPGISAD